jgi:shikimate kinase
MRIYLIGLPGVGKSTVGKELSKELDYEYVDLDLYIEKLMNKSIPDIFSEFGEDFFRELEKKALNDMLNKQNVVVACGGGIIKDKTNKELMKGKVIYLTAPIEFISERINNSNIDRPLMSKYTVKELLMKREELYHYFMDLEVMNLDLKDTINVIKKSVGE